MINRLINNTNSNVIISNNAYNNNNKTKQANKQQQVKKTSKNDDIFKRMISKYYNITTDTKVVAPTPPQKGNSSKSGQCASECHWAAYNGDINKLESLLDLQNESEILDSLGKVVGESVETVNINAPELAIRIENKTDS